MREDEDPIFIRAVLYVERPSQKGILIGRSGVGIKELGTRSRAKIEEFLGARAYLDMWVKVLPKWRKSPQELRRFGFPVPEEKV
jgi:GTP-binding protein Era